MNDNHNPVSRPVKLETIRILLVEDDDDSAFLLKTMLPEWQYGGFNIRRVDTLAAAVRVVAEGGSDIILLDLGLPDSQGLGTFVRMHEAAAGLPIIVLTGVDDEGLATTIVQQGAQDYIVKGSIDRVALALTIRYAIERSRAQQALAEEHTRLRSVINNIPDQIYMKDLKSRFVAVNPVTARFFGAASPDQIIGKSDFDYFPRELAEQFLAEEQELLLRGLACVNREASITDSAGNRRWVLTTKVPLRDSAGNITGLLGINRDITERKAVEDATRRQNAELEQRVMVRTSELRKAMTRLEEHDRARAEFVSSVSHELKTPLASMKFEIANLLAGVVGPLPDRVAEYLHMLEADCLRMTQTVDDILDFSRLESKVTKLHRSKLLFEKLIRQAAAALRTQAQAKNISMELPMGFGFVDCDAFKMMRAIINIIGNAIKFTPEKGKVEVGLRVDPAAPGVLIVDITDNGIGIAQEHLARVTDKYFRAAEHISGAGLGLSIAKEIVALHGGWLTIQSPPPERARGTRVSVGLPLVPPPAILIANENAQTKQMLEQQLRSYGYHVTVCSNPGEAIDLVRAANLDVVILDLSPPIKGEPDLFLQLKADRSLKGLPIVVVASGVVDPARQIMLAELGIPILQKPWSDEDMLDRIEAAIRGRALFTLSDF